MYHTALIANSQLTECDMWCKMFFINVAYIQSVLHSWLWLYSVVILFAKFSSVLQYGLYQNVVLPLWVLKNIKTIVFLQLCIFIHWVKIWVLKQMLCQGFFVPWQELVSLSPPVFLLDQKRLSRLLDTGDVASKAGVSVGLKCSCWWCLGFCFIHPSINLFFLSALWTVQSHQFAWCL